MVEKPIVKIDHCNCQKPEVIMVEAAKPTYQEVPKEIII
jgi:histidinol phosphatase-like enzyme